jgi:hypothetical protein
MTTAELADRLAITDLVSHLGLWLDEKRFDDARSVLVEDVSVSTPGGQAQGIERVVAQASRNHEDDTQHAITNVLIDVDGDRATVGANLVVTFARDGARIATHGERYRFQAVRTPEGWRLSRIEVKPVWRAD